MKPKQARDIIMANTIQSKTVFYSVLHMGVVAVCGETQDS